ncbi:MAG: type I methionyl aminopeptidase [Candidatus Nomurabacteria bacterium]|nr:MAG: type I methionyl aminopeptidase [Candidatus Nomurabacteria bacterium]HRV75767.1 type I methionyl aminopeptidase [Candidatus Saccharimonadales bacterium]
MSKNLNRVKTQEEIQAMREGGRMLAEVLQFVKLNTKAGMTTKDLANLASAKLEDLGGEPAFLGYRGYPDVMCIAVNEEVQHTIPGSRVINEGDIVNCDFGVLWKGLITDAAITYPVGEISEEARNLLKGTEEALNAALKVVKHGVRVKDVSKVIGKTLQNYGLDVVRELCGHGVGHSLHEDPDIPNYGPDGGSFKLKAGMTIAIEPIAVAGKADVEFLPDGWNIITKDGSWACQFEHSILVTYEGCEILTK